MATNAEQVLNEMYGKGGFVIITAAMNEVTASELGYDCFTEIVPNSGASATVKALSSVQIEHGDPASVISDLTGNGAPYATGTYCTLLPNETVEFECTKIHVDSGAVRAKLGRKTTTFAANRPN